MDRSEIDAFIVSSTRQYVSQRVASGEDEITAARAADEQASSLFPGGALAANHLMFRLEDDGLSLGSLWIGPADSGEPGQWWIWDIAIDEEHRGRGYGKAAMLLAEKEARASGASELGLSVFGFNTVARRLYESLGYETIAIRMSKKL
jgi:ribosomal protein S18 acetylase RimI-like enzyme